MELNLLYDTLQLSQLDRQTIGDLWEINNSDNNKEEFCCVLAVLFRQFSNGSLCLSFNADDEEMQIANEWRDTFAAGKKLFSNGSFSGVTAKACGDKTAFLPLVLRTLNNGEQLLYFYRCWKSEETLRSNLKLRLACSDNAAVHRDINCPEEEGLEAKQKEAVRLVPDKNFLIVTGGPGTGKTYTAARMIKKTLRLHPDWKIALAAPTGKAAKRLEESLALNGFSGLSGQTLHRLLGIRRGSVTAVYNHENQLPYDLILIDEISMVDIHLFSALLDAVSDETRLILLGDNNQLPSVDAGSVLADLVYNSSSVDNSGWLCNLNASTVCLDTTRRTENEIMRSVFEKIKSGDVSVVNDFLQTESSPVKFAVVPEDERESFAFLRDFLKKYIDNADFAPNSDSQNQTKILTVNRTGFWGCKNINNMLEEYFGFQRDGTPIIVTGNIYEQNLFNGDCGWLVGGKEKKMAVPDREAVSLRLLEGNYETAFAVTIHKSQGSEYKNVIIILPPEENNALLSREILYTGVTRAKEKITVIGRKSVFEAALKRRIFRCSGLTKE